MGVGVGVVVFGGKEGLEDREARGGALPCFFLGGGGVGVCGAFVCGGGVRNIYDISI